MKEIIIRQQHPIIEGVERKSITVDEGNNCTVIVYGKKEESKFKRGDIVKWSGSNPLIGIVSGENRHDGQENYIIHSPFKQDERTHNSCHFSHIRLATPEEKQLLFTALAKEGKRWNAERLELEDILKVPESIKLYQPKKNNDQIYIGFGDRQLLGVCNGSWHVIINDKDMPCKPIECKLVPCNFEDLKDGDTAFVDTGMNLKAGLSCYCKMIDEYIIFARDHDVIHRALTDDEFEYAKWYKVVPIKE